MPESMMATPMPLPVGSVSVSPSSARSSLFFTSPLPVLLKRPSEESGAEVTGASMEIDATPGSVSSHARSLVEMENEIALASGASRKIVTPRLRSAVCSEAQSRLLSARMMTAMVSPWFARLLICRSRLRVACPPTAKIPAPGVPPTSRRAPRCAA